MALAKKSTTKKTTGTVTPSISPSGTSDFEKAKQQTQTAVNRANARAGKRRFSFWYAERDYGKYPRYDIFVVDHDNPYGKSYKHTDFIKNWEALVQVTKQTGDPASVKKSLKHSAFIQGMLDYYGDVDMRKVRNKARLG